MARCFIPLVRTALIMGNSFENIGGAKGAEDVIPLTEIDSTALNYQLVVTFAFVFNGKLDHIKLREALYELISKKYRALGARLWKNPVRDSFLLVTS
jgi:hypothetical protein